MDFFKNMFSYFFDNSNQNSNLQNSNKVRNSSETSDENKNQQIIAENVINAPTIINYFRNENTPKTPIRFDLHELTIWFIGRETELADIHSKLQAEPGDGVIIKTVAIVGMGGMGKTQLTRKYAEMYKNQYKHIIWINAENLENLTASFTRLHINMCKECRHNYEKDVKFCVDFLYDFLGENETALLIFDNVEKFKDIKTFMPRIRPHLISTLISSRYRNWDIAELGEVKIVELKGFSEVDACNYVKEHLKEENDIDVLKLVEELQAFPLGLKIAVKYIKEHNSHLKLFGEKFKISDYLTEYKNRPETLLDNVNENDIYEKTIKATLNVTIRRICNDSPLAEKVLHILSYFDPIVDSKLFICAFCECFEEFNKVGVSIAVKTLDSYSMINSVVNKYKHGKITIHRLVQHTMRAILKNENKEEKVLDESIKILSHFKKYSNQIELHASMVWSFVVSYDDLMNRHYSNVKYGLHDLSPIHLFSKYHNDALMKIVKRDYIDVNLLTEDNCTPLHLAIESGYLEGVKHLSQTGFVFNETLCSLFQWWDEHHNVNMIYDLLFNELISFDRQYDVNNRGEDFYTVDLESYFKNWYLDMFHCENCEIEKVSCFLLDTMLKKYNHNIKKCCQHTMYNVTLCKNDTQQIHCDISWLKMKKKIELNLSFQPRLHLAAKNGHLKLVQYFIEEGENPREFDDEGQTAVHVAAHFTQISILKYFIDEVKIDVNIKNRMGRTPLHEAARYGIFPIDILKYLVYKGANIEAEDNFGLTPIYYSLHNKEMIEYFLKSGAQLTCSTNSLLGKLGITVSQFAILKNDFSALKILMEKEPSVNELYGSRCLFGLHSQVFENKIGLIFNNLNQALKNQEQQFLSTIKISTLAVKVNLMTNIVTYDKRENKQEKNGCMGSSNSDVIDHHNFLKTILNFVKEKPHILSYIIEQSKGNNERVYWKQIQDDSNVKFKFRMPSQVDVQHNNETLQYWTFFSSKCLPTLVEFSHQPSSSVPNFIGREDTIKEIGVHLQNGRNVVVLGEAGVGKSELIRKYAEVYKDFYEHIIWMNADTRGGLLAVFEHIRKENNLKDVKHLAQLIKSVHEHFRSSKQILYVFDNAVSFSKIEDFVSECGCHIIINSRSKDWNESGLSRSVIVELNNFSLQEASLYVKERIPTVKDPENVERLVNILECHPLALQHAVGYMKRSGEIEIRKYLQKFSKCKSTDGWHKDNSYNANCIKTWMIIFDSIKNDIKASSKFKELIYHIRETESELKNIKPHHQENFNLIKLFSSVKAFVEITKIYLWETKEEEVVLKRILEFHKLDKIVPFDFWNRILQYPRLVEECFENQHENIFNFIVNSIINWQSVQLRKLIKLLKKYTKWPLNIAFGPCNTSFGYVEQMTTININSTTRILRNLKKRTLLHLAAANNNKEILNLLIENGHRMDSIDNLEMTPVMLAAYLGNVEIVDILTENKRLRFMARLYTAVNNDNEERFLNILQQFKSDNLSTNLDSIFEFSILHKVCVEDEDQSMTCVSSSDIIKQTYLDTILKNSIRTRLHDTALNGNLDAVKSLIENGHEANKTDFYKNTTLHFASLSGSVQLVEFLITEQNCKLDLRNSFGDTPLHMAALSGHINVVILLVENGANFKAENSIGATPELYAAFGDNFEIVQFFIDQHHTSNSNPHKIPIDSSNDDIQDEKEMFEEEIPENIELQELCCKENLPCSKKYSYADYCFDNDDSQSTISQSTIPQSTISINEDLVPLLQSFDVSLLHIALVFNSVSLAEIAMKSDRRMLCDEINFIPCFVKLFSSQEVFQHLVENNFVTDKRFSSSEIDEFMKRFKLNPKYVSLFLESKLYLLTLFDFLKNQNNKSEIYYSSLNIVENIVRNIS